MNIKKTALVSLVVILVSIALYFAYGFISGGPRSRLMGFEPEKQKYYNSIEIGMPKSQVLDALGTQRSIEKRFALPQRKGFEESFKRAELSNSVEYYLWMNGTNWYYCIGFDENNNVSTKGEGNS